MPLLWLCDAPGVVCLLEDAGVVFEEEEPLLHGVLNLIGVPRLDGVVRLDEGPRFESLASTIVGKSS